MVSIKHWAMENEQWAMAVGKSQWAWRALVAWAVGNAKACSCLGICLVTFPPATDNDKLDFLLWTLSSSLPNLVLHLNLTAAAAATCCWKTLACCGRWPSPLVHDLFLQQFSRPFQHLSQSSVQSLGISLNILKYSCKILISLQCTLFCIFLNILNCHLLTQQWGVLKIQH